MKFLQVDELSGHQATGGLGFVAEQLGRHPPFRRAQLHQQPAHHLGGQFIEQAHPIIGRHLLHQLQHLAGAQALQQGLLHRWFEVFVHLNRFVLGQQPKGQGLEGAGQQADRLGRIHLLHGPEQQLGAVVIACLQQGFQLFGHHLGQQDAGFAAGGGI